MDENNVNPKPLDSDDSASENTQPVTNESEVMPDEAVQTEQADIAEVNDSEQVNDAEPETVEEAADASEPVEAEENAEPVKKKKKGRGAKAAIVVLVLIMIVAIVSMVAVIIKSENAKIDLEQTVLSVNDVDSSAAEFYQIYMYYYGYNSYYQYSEEELKDLAIKQLVFTNALYAEATDAGYTLNDEDNALIEEQLASVTQTAEASSMTADEYLDSNYCKGFTLDMFREIVEKNQLAQRYYTDKMTAIEEQYKGDDGKAKIEAEYKENKLDYDLSDVSYWYFDASEETAQADADAVVAQVKNGKAFTDAIKSVTGDSEAVPNNLAGYSKSELESGNFAEAAIEWIFEENEDGSYKNGAGAVTTVDDESVIYVLYVNDAPGRDETLPVTAYYIQVDVSTDDSIKTENELKLQAKSTADAILKEFEKTDKSVKSFTELVYEHDNGDNDLVSGDVFEELKNDGTEDEAVEAWAFDEARKTGDYALVEGDGCYYILFFAEKAEAAVWYQTALNNLIVNEAGSFETSIIEKYEAITVTNDEAVNEVVAYVANMVSSQYGY